MFEYNNHITCIIIKENPHLCQTRVDRFHSIYAILNRVSDDILNKYPKINFIIYLRWHYPDQAKGFKNIGVVLISAEFIRLTCYVFVSSIYFDYFFSVLFSMYCVKKKVRILFLFLFFASILLYNIKNTK